VTDFGTDGEKMDFGAFKKTLTKKSQPSYDSLVVRRSSLAGLPLFFEQSEQKLRNMEVVEQSSEVALVDATLRALLRCKCRSSSSHQGGIKIYAKP